MKQCVLLRHCSSGTLVESGHLFNRDTVGRLYTWSTDETVQKTCKSLWHRCKFEVLESSPSSSILTCSRNVGVSDVGRYHYFLTNTRKVTG